MSHFSNNSEFCLDYFICEDDRTDSRSSHGMVSEQVMQLIKLSRKISSEGLEEANEDA